MGKNTDPTAGRKPLEYGSVDAINVGGRYYVDADGKARRADAESTEMPAEAAPAEAEAPARGAADQAANGARAPVAEASAKT